MDVEKRADVGRGDALAGIVVLESSTMPEELERVAEAVPGVEAVPVTIPELVVEAVPVMTSELVDDPVLVGTPEVLEVVGSSSFSHKAKPEGKLAA